MQISNWIFRGYDWQKNDMIKLNLSNTTSFASHRSGWSYCMSCLAPAHSKSGIYFDDFLEKAFSWSIKDYYHYHSNNIPYKKDWIGVIHNPPGVPDWFDSCNSPQAIIQRDLFQKSLKTCKALVSLSEYVAEFLRSKVDVPVISVKHPTEIPDKKWSMDNFVSQKRKEVVQLGYWLRIMRSIYYLKCDYKYKKIWLPGDTEKAPKMLQKELHYKNLSVLEDEYNLSGVFIDRVSNEEYDDLFSRCVCLVNLFDTSANNAVVECVARNTPILINRLPAAEEYLGKDYPLFFNDLDHASSLLYDIDKIYEAHVYLKNMDKRWISGFYFANDLTSKLESVM